MAAVPDVHELERILRDSAPGARQAAILNPANPPDVLESLLLARLPAGTAPPGPDFWHRPEWWEPAADIALLLERRDIAPAAFEPLAARGLWTLVSGDERAPAAVLERAARESRDPFVLEKLAENRSTPEAALAILRREGRRRLPEGLLWMALLPVNAVLALLWWPAEAAHWGVVAVLAILMPVTATTRYRPLRPLRLEFHPTSSSWKRSRLRQLLQARAGKGE